MLVRFIRGLGGCIRLGRVCDFLFGVGEGGMGMDMLERGGGRRGDAVKGIIVGDRLEDLKDTAIALERDIRRTINLADTKKHTG